MAGVVDQRLPAGERLPVEIAVLERIAEHAERIDRHVGVADRLAQSFASLGRSLFIVCQKKGSMLSKPSPTIWRT